MSVFIRHHIHRDGWLWEGIVDLELLYYVYGWSDHAKLGVALGLGVRVSLVSVDIHLRADPGTGLEATIGPTLHFGS